MTDVLIITCLVCGRGAHHVETREAEVAPQGGVRCYVAVGRIFHHRDAPRLCDQVIREIGPRLDVPATPRSMTWRVFLRRLVGAGA